MVYPNPFTNKIIVSFGHVVKNCRVVLYDASGRELSTKNENNVKSVELSGLNVPNGMYILKIQGETLFYTRKLLSIRSLKK